MKKIIPFLVLCLVATCNAELRTWTAVNGKEVEAEFVSNEKGVIKLKLKSGKVFEVPANKLSKEDNEFITSLTKPEGVNAEKLEGRDGIAYVKDKPYTGKSYKLYPNGQKQSEINFKNGKFDGAFITWYENGQKETEVNFKNGEPEGLGFAWHRNGQKAMEGMVENEDSQKFWNSKGESVNSFEETGLK